MKLFRIIRLTFYAIFITGLASVYYVYSDAISEPLSNRDKTLVIPKGVGEAWLANHLAKQGVIDNKYVFRAYKKLNLPDATIKAGEYTLVDVNDIPELVEYYSEYFSNHHKKTPPKLRCNDITAFKNCSLSIHDLTLKKKDICEEREAVVLPGERKKSKISAKLRIPPQGYL